MKVSENEWIKVEENTRQQSKRVELVWKSK